MKTATYSKRTQISLSPQLKAIIESEGTLLKESLSEYLRKAAILRLLLQEIEKDKLTLVAESVIGKTPKNKGGWKNIKNIVNWQRKQRQNENRHRP